MKTFSTIFLFISLHAFGQENEKKSERVSFIHGRHFDGVIFSADYKLPIFEQGDKGRFTPTADEIFLFERELQKRIKGINKNKPNQGRHYGPVIDKRLKMYTRQYAGFINVKGEKVIHAGLNWKRKEKRWKTDFILVLDGGSYHWTIRYNLEKDEFLHFGVNGIASVPRPPMLQSALNYKYRLIFK